MDIQNVLARLKILTNDDRDELLLMLSGDAVHDLEKRLVCGEEEREANDEALCAAAAANAAYRFWILEEAASPKSLTAGEVRAEYDGGSEKALLYVKRCEQAVSGLLRDGNFYFGTTEAFCGA